MTRAPEWRQSSLLARDRRSICASLALQVDQCARRAPSDASGPTARSRTAATPRCVLFESGHWPPSARCRSCAGRVRGTAQCGSDEVSDATQPLSSRGQAHRAVGSPTATPRSAPRSAVHREPFLGVDATGGKHPPRRGTRRRARHSGPRSARGDAEARRCIGWAVRSGVLTSAPDRGARAADRASRAGPRSSTWNAVPRQAASGRATGARTCSTWNVPRAADVGRQPSHDADVPRGTSRRSVPQAR